MEEDKALQVIKSLGSEPACPKALPPSCSLLWSHQAVWEPDVPLAVGTSVCSQSPSHNATRSDLSRQNIF